MAVYTGTEANDTLRGSEGADYIDARGANDTLLGFGGNDTLLGGWGEDSLDGGYGADTLTGNGGRDSFFFRNLEASADRITDFFANSDELVFDNNGFTQIGTTGAWAVGDARFASGAGFTSGRDASDRIIYDSSSGNLYYDADGSGAGASRLVATLQGAPSITAADITVVGLSGVTVYGSPSSDNVSGTRYSDTMYGYGGNDTLYGLDSDDVLDGGVGIDRLDGGLGNDTYYVTAGDVIVDAGGHETVYSDASWSLAIGLENLKALGTNAISLQGNNGNNRLEGNGGANYMNGRAGNDTLIGNGGNDTFDISAGGTSSYGNDVIDGGSGFDTVDFVGNSALGAITVNLATGTASGGGGTLRMTGIERVYGGGYSDRMTGSSRADTFYGQNGNDTLAGAGGNDTLHGGAGRDSFVFAEAGSGNADRIYDFASGTDELLFENGVLTGLGAAGAWSTGDARFWAAPGAVSGHDANDRLIYNTSTGSLYYDADGSGAGASQLVAMLQGTLVAGDITVI